jgi:hypothetical protein
MQYCIQGAGDVGQAGEHLTMRLICYPTSGERPSIQPASVERDWMGRTDQAFAYRCLPLAIANAHGWAIANKAPLLASWNGGPATDDLKIASADGSDGGLMATSHFGHGVLTFTIAGLFRTEPGYDLWVTGPVNMVKDGIQPLSGVVEADWSPFTFTMNWKLTRKDTPVAFEADEPICMLFPIARGLVESVEPEFRSLDEDEDWRRAYTEWSQDRARFNDDLTDPSSPAARQKWQKDYFHGAAARWGVAPADHRTKLRLKPFK